MLEEDIRPFPDFNWRDDFQYRVDERTRTASVGAYGSFPEVDDAELTAALDWAMAQPQNTRALVVVRLGPSPGGYNAYLNEVVGRVVRSITPE